MRALGEHCPKLKFGIAWFRSNPERFVEPLPFRRHWAAIVVVGAIFGGFCVPLVTVGSTLDVEMDGDLFSLIFMLFNALWLLAWSVAVAVLGLLFFALLLGREVLVVTQGNILIRLEVLRIGVGAHYDVSGVMNLRIETPDDASGDRWRGQHLAFDYRGIPVAFGSNIVEPAASRLMDNLRKALVVPVANGPTPEIVVTDNPDTDEPVESPRILAERDSSSTALLIAANLIPLGGVVFFGWSLAEVMILFWAESAIIGIFTLMKLLKINKWGSLFMGPFFLGHYGGFMVMHLLFVYGFFIQGPNSGEDILVSTVVRDFISLWPALLALTLSHGWSFYTNFLGRREYRHKTLSQQMSDPYKRIFVMHLTVIFGGFIVLLLETPLPALLLLILLKIYADARAHRHQHTDTAADPG